MKARHRPNGPGGRATSAFVAEFAALTGGRVAETEGALRVSFGDGRPDETIPHQPASETEWASRFKWVEKEAAVILRNPPLLYTIAWPAARRSKQSKKTMLRLSATLSLSVGEPLARRYVVTLERGGKEARVDEGGVLPPADGADLAPMVALPAWAERDVRTLCRALAATCEAFQLLPDVQNALRALGELRRTELAYLEHLYARREGEYERLWGLPARGTQGSAAVEAEQRRLRQIVLERYAARIRVRPLSLGLLHVAG
ncbi:MAG TPA: hypothetical protein VF266_23600 [Thermoanaerobaculia bacterium]